MSQPRELNCFSLGFNLRHAPFTCGLATCRKACCDINGRDRRSARLRSETTAFLSSANCRNSQAVRSFDNPQVLLGGIGANSQQNPNSGRNRQADPPAPHPAWGLELLPQHAGKGENTAQQEVHSGLDRAPRSSTANIGSATLSSQMGAARLTHGGEDLAHSADPVSIPSPDQPPSFCPITPVPLLCSPSCPESLC